jgi:hypothetical protein
MGGIFGDDSEDSDRAFEKEIEKTFQNVLGDTAGGSED